MTTCIYRAIMLAIERKRQSLGWPSWYLDDRAGTQDGYFQKLLHMETPTGRHARWETLQLLIDALWPDGVGLVLFRGEPIPDDETMRRKIKTTAARYGAKAKRQRSIPAHLREYASAKEARP